MAFAKQPELLRCRIAEYATSCQLSLQHLASVRAFFMPVAVNPGVSLGYQPTPHVLALQVQRTHRTAILVMGACNDHHVLFQHLALERLKRLDAAWLTNLGGIHILETDFQHRPLATVFIHTVSPSTTRVTTPNCA